MKWPGELKTPGRVGQMTPEQAETE